MPAYDPLSWQNFYVMTGGAAAALTGLLDFWAWRSLAEGQELDDEKAAILMTEMVTGIAR